MSRLIVGSEATAPNNSGWARTSAASARQSPPSAIATARSSTVLPGSWIERATRHGRSCPDRPATKPLTCAVCMSSDAPAEEISDSLPDSTRNPPQRLRFTYGVPSRLQNMDPRTSHIFSSRTGTSVHYTPVTSPLSRKIEARCQPARCRVDGPGEQLGCTMDDVQEIEDYAVDAQSCGRVGVESSVQTGRHGPTTLRGQEIRNSSSTATGPSLTSSTGR